MYLNEEEIGRAIQEKIANGTVKRQDIFYTSKVMCIVAHVSLKLTLGQVVSWCISLLIGLIFIHSQTFYEKVG